ncbi:MAG: hypothetical protein HOV96_27235 [Nonomuraea sp.]|nr:hypothetical protein [Nonomuraea sp.]NUP81238.1 hypothetical protein [Nonomuraea sp.]NUS01475.1 hypothetical protein [Nonomuraea sp.]
MSKRSRRRRALTSGAPAPKPGYGPGEPHGPDDSGDPPKGEDGGGGRGEGGVREPRRPKPVPPSSPIEAAPPDPPIHAGNPSVPPPGEVVQPVA